MATPYWTLDQVYTQLYTGFQWSDSVITYAFPSKPNADVQYGEADLFRAANPTQQALITQALQTWDDLIAPSFRQTTVDSSDIEFAYTGSNIAYAHAYYPVDGGIWLNRNEPTLTSPQVGSYGFLAIVHEIGHALGLDHMGNYDGDGLFAPSSFQDSSVLSIMSYFGPYGSSSQYSTEVAEADWQAVDGEDYSPQTPMVNDVAVIQRIYGASSTTRTDDTVYGFASNITGTAANIYNFAINQNPILTIFDSAGQDTINISEFTGQSRLSLIAGTYSSCNDMSSNLAIAYDCIIENAVTGSGPDRIVGNAAANRIDAGAGDDTILGGDGDDVLIGGLGNNSIDGGDGNDIAVLAGPLASYTFDYDAVRNLYTITDAATETSTFSSIEYFQFSDVLIPVDQSNHAEDRTAPTLLGQAPADDDSAVAVDANWVLNFSEKVQVGSGDIVFYNTNGSVAQVIDIADLTHVLVLENTVTINPPADLASGASYYVKMDPGALKDLAGNPFAGITDSTVWNFSTDMPVLSDDYSNTANTTEILTLDAATPTAGNINYQDDTDFFKVYLTAGTSYAFTLTRVTGGGQSDTPFVPGNGNTDIGIIMDGGLSDPYLQLYSPDIELITYDDDSAGDGNATITYTATSTGLHYLSAQDYEDGTGAYQLSAVTAHDDYVWSDATTGQVVVDGTASAGSINNTGDGDLFKVTLTAGNTYTFALSRSGNTGLIDPYLSLFGPDMTELSFDDESGGDGNAEITFSVSDSGTYYLGAMDYDIGTGDYLLSAITTPDDYPESVDTTGEVVVNGVPSFGTIGIVYDADLFTVELNAGTTYTFVLSSTGSSGLSDPYLLLYGPDLKGLRMDDESGGNGNAQITFTARTSGTHYLGAVDYDTGIGSYMLRATIGGNGVLQGTAQPDVLIDEAASSRIDGFGGDDWIEGGAGDDLINGGAGIDWAGYAGERNDYSLLASTAGRWTLTDDLELDGVDTLLSVERLSFADINLALDMNISQSGGKTALLVGAALGVEWLDQFSLLGGLLNYFDDGHSLADAASMLVDAGVMRVLAGGDSNLALAQWLYQNVTDTPTDMSIVNEWVDMVDSGTYTQAELLAAVAAMPMNQDHVDLVGLAANGLVFV